ncbi:MAG: SCO family protein [Magnetococcales bacterium]|nr:SCO family protein [Magnetococcales bacterium]
MLPTLRKHKNQLVFVVFGILFTLVVQIGYKQFLESRQPPVNLEKVVLAKPRGMGAFDLIDHQGRPFQTDRLLGPWTFLVFGMTHCSADCPGSPTLLDEVRRILPNNPRLVPATQWVFATVDPRRDQPEVLQGYLSRLTSGWTGVTGSDEAVRHFAEELGVTLDFSRPQPAGPIPPATIILFNPKGRWHASFGPDWQDPRAIAETFLQIVQRFSKR